MILATLADAVNANPAVIILRGEGHPLLSLLTARESSATMEITLDTYVLLKPVFPSCFERVQA